MSKAIMEVQRDALLEAVTATDDRDLISIHNYICRERNNNPDDEIFDMDCIDELISLDGYKSILDVWYLFDSSFNPNDDYFWFDGYATLHSGVLCEAVEQVCIADICDNLLKMYEDGALDDIAYDIKDTPIADWVDWMESEDTEDDIDDAEAAD